MSAIVTRERLLELLKAHPDTRAYGEIVDHDAVLRAERDAAAVAAKTEWCRAEQAEADRDEYREREHALRADYHVIRDAWDEATDRLAEARVLLKQGIGEADSKYHWTERLTKWETETLAFIRRTESKAGPELAGEERNCSSHEEENILPENRCGATPPPASSHYRKMEPPTLCEECDHLYPHGICQEVGLSGNRCLCEHVNSLALPDERSGGGVVENHQSLATAGENPAAGMLGKYKGKVGLGGDLVEVERGELAALREVEKAARWLVHHSNGAIEEDRAERAIDGAIAALDRVRCKP